jgi:hypothetical protein
LNRALLLIGGGAVAVFAMREAYVTGHRHGLRDCPAATQLKADRMAQIDEEIRQLNAMPSGRDMVCEQMFDLVGSELAQEFMWLDRERHDAQEGVERNR